MLIFVSPAASTAASTEHRPSIDRASTEHRPSIDRASTGHRPSIDRASTEHRPSVDRTSTEHRPSIDRASTERRPSIDRTSTERRPNVEQKERGNILLNCARFRCLFSCSRKIPKSQILVDQSSTEHRPSIDRASTEHRPKVGAPFRVDRRGKVACYELILWSLGVLRFAVRGKVEAG